MGAGASEVFGFATADDRMRYVCQLLEGQDGVTVGELATTFGVSEVTVRSDLAALAHRGLIARIRGGARALQRGQSEVAFDVRLRVQEQSKRAVAAAAAALVGDGEAIALDSSTTAFYIAQQLRDKHELVVGKVGRDGSCVVDVPLHPQRQRLQPLQEQEGIER